MDRRIHALLFVTALVLPIAIVVCVAAARLLAAVGDTAGGTGLDRLALILGILWIVNLVSLVLAQSWHQLGPPPPRRDPRPGEPPCQDDIEEL